MLSVFLDNLLPLIVLGIIGFIVLFELSESRIDHKRHWGTVVVGSIIIVTGLVFAAITGWSPGFR